MAHISSEIQDVPPKDESTGSETSIRSPLCDYTLTEDSVLRSKIEEDAFQALFEEVVIKTPQDTFSVSETDEVDDFLLRNFPQKLWKIVESDRFKSIWWDESGTSIVINEEVFKKEVLERKGPFRIFATGSMKSFVRQLNIYGFRKQTFQRSASLADFLEENNVSVLSKLQIYCNPNFKRGYPQLIVRMKRRVGSKKVSPISSLVRDYKKNHVKARGNIDDRNSNFLPETSGESAFSAATSLSVPFIREPYTRQTVANTSALSPCDFPSPSSISVRQTEQIVIDQLAVLNQWSIFNRQSHRSYTQANGRVENFATATTFTSQNYIIFPLQSSYFGLMVEPSKFPVRYSDMSAHDNPFPNLQQRGNSWSPVPRIHYTSVSSLSGQLIKNLHYMKTILIKTDLSKNRFRLKKWLLQKYKRHKLKCPFKSLLSLFKVQDKRLSSTNCYIPGHLPSSYTRIKLCPCQSLTFDTHLKQLSLQSRNKESVLCENVRTV
ncbi:LOW QUALITY PROTEIN: heat shock transcription factor, Y-linked-like [Moschus berezovskii]|uniref:LOW QUALITY PROTEIN: heat shock transcription factor, Y-linked-like n=1 Tax=Moschus berezovskii TaxID=68408 RepID=UPI0024440786|nr:LOW QUALITY PROTEIN: heat shock transcription factor, Y-linked-like [Moschus berezovskii]